MLRMVFAAFFTWWYGAGWRLIITAFPRLSRKLDAALSMQVLAATLFYPWRRITSQGGRGLGAALAAFVDNTISRVVGAIMRGSVLLAGLLSLVFGGIGIMVFAILWPLIPLAPFLLVFKGLAG